MRHIIRRLAASPDSFQTTMADQNINPADEIMCPCSGTTRGDIQCLFEQGLDIEGISRRTGALTGCGGCEWDISEFLQELAATRNRS